MNNILVVGPYFGEFGWECFAWQPIVRGLALQPHIEKVIVYGSPGKSKMYRFAEYREMELPFHESECMAWQNLPQYGEEVNTIGQNLINDCRKEFNNFEFFWFNNLNVLNQPQYNRGCPELLYNNDPVVFDIPDNAIVLCTRNRKMSTYRNWSQENWFQLAAELVKDYPVVVVGKTEEEWEMPEGVVNLIGKTTIDDLISIFGKTRLAIGGSTGTMHLASRCGTDHLVWGVPKNITRYAETNWFASNHKVYSQWGWFIEPEKVVELTRHHLEKGEWKDE